jgi:hypothetical protein
MVAVAITGVVLCCIWASNIRSYRQLNGIKFQIIRAMEAQLPLSPYADEWQLVGKRERRYTRLTHVEQFVPVILALAYFALGLYEVWLLHPVLSWPFA